MARVLLLLLLPLISGISAQNLSVYQSPYVVVVEGAPVTLQCSYDHSEETTIGHYNWFYSGAQPSTRLEVSEKVERYRGRFSQTDQDTFFTKRKADITIQGVRLYDTGKYVCEVELLGIGFGCGNGTFLTVTPGAPDTQKMSEEKKEFQIPMSFLLQLARTIVVLFIFGVSVLLIMRYYARKWPRPRGARPLQAKGVTE